MADGDTHNRAAYFLKLEVKNVRCFGEPSETLDLSDGRGRPRRWTLLLGNNGTGKTTLLQLLAGFTQRAFERYHELQPLPPPFLVWELNNRTSGYVRHTASSEYRVGATLAVGDSIKSAVGGSDDEYVICPDLMVGKAEARPCCFAYGAARKSQAEMAATPANPTDSLFDDQAALVNAQSWLLELDYSAAKDSPNRARQKARLEQVKRLLIGRILPELTGVRFDAGSGPVPKPRVEFQSPYGWVPLDRLGHGYRGMIAWLVDFTARMIERYPDSEEPTHQPAVVLIDEIDLHLHPNWQRRLIPYLSEKFPNTQFVATAHSPLIVQGAGDDANIAVLRREEGEDRVRIINGLRPIPNARVDQILTSELFGLESARPPDLDAGMQRRRELLTKPGRLTKAERAELDELERLLPGLPVAETATEARRMEEALRKADEILSRHADTGPKRKRSARRP